MLQAFLLCFLLLASNPPAGAATITLANGEWPPFLSESKPHYGVASRIVTESFKAVAIDVKYVFLPWKRSYLMVKEGVYEGSLVWGKTPKRLKEVFFTDPVMTHETALFYKKENPKIKQALNSTIPWEQRLKGLKVVLSLGSTSTFFDKLQEQDVIKVQRTRKPEHSLQMLLIGRVDIVPLNAHIGRYILNTKFEKEQAKLIGTTKSHGDSRWTYHVIISKSAPQGASLVNQFNKGLKKIREKGLYQEIMKDFQHSQKPAP
ncbi:substrate-binding periplasmic protein [Pseudobacteriovorax antillogorgiicola]|uniref:Polar amino acid transport system substrate-binding protein n=2 Tax=Pseudobacteriovorax antillogorgiicola TaxID=1513793 RepID=A0A1Y6BPQ0_9BACT|nr:transporter substrate-binding domain-containing protein [Pseudobacteriovorax antillogorgiicola]TCS53732.1 polar amino acid transport system substrate-binding protein [Pseudobacteriovorax antillogorgiicola]SMF22730.1 polar amino acid transport system substrate-binding protein [Pseudobacteriovorax antillogorgiicola]